LDVAMDDAACVRVIERRGDGARNREHILQRKLALALQAIRQRFAINVRHGVVRPPVDRAGLVDRQDVRMAQMSFDLDLSKESRKADGGSQLLTQDLERNEAPALGLAGKIDEGGPAPAKLAFDGMPPCEAADQRIPRRGRAGAVLLG